MAEEKEKPLTREDVLKLIEENGGTARSLDLSGKVFEKGIDLQGVDLEGIILMDANLVDAQLKWVKIMDAHLEGADLWEAYLEGADLTFAHLEGADLWEARLEGAVLSGTTFSADTNLEDVDWGNYILGEEKNGAYRLASETYRRLKLWYTEHGMYHVAGKFFYREMEAKRKAMKWWPNPFPRAWSTFISLICGYGERPVRVIVWAASVIVISTLVYFIIGSVWEWSAFWNSLYFSAVSFTALGYGSWLQVTNDWIRGIGAFESFIGVFTIALFLITFIRKMTR